MKRSFRILCIASAILFLTTSCNEGETSEMTTNENITTEEITAAPATEESTNEITEELTEAVTEPVKSESDKLAEILRSSADLQAEVKNLYKITRPYSANNESLLLNAVQGGTVAGKFHYQVFLKKVSDNEAENVVRIIKYSTERNIPVKMSQDLSLCHANDIAYIPEDNQLYVVHNAPYRTQVSVLDAGNLEYIETKTIFTEIYCMTYQPERQQFVVGLSGGQNFLVLSKELKRVGKIHIATTLTTGYTTQGCSCDENFIYFVLYNPNVITVYDWDGNFVTLIHFNVGSIEPENISVVDGNIYVTCGNSGADVYQIIPKAVN